MTSTTPAGADVAQAAPAALTCIAVGCTSTHTRLWPGGRYCREHSVAWPTERITPGQRLREHRAREAAAKAEIRALLDSEGAHRD